MAADALAIALMLAELNIPYEVISTVLSLLPSAGHTYQRAILSYPVHAGFGLAGLVPLWFVSPLNLLNPPLHCSIGERLASLLVFTILTLP